MAEPLPGQGARGRGQGFHGSSGILAELSQCSPASRAVVSRALAPSSWSAGALASPQVRATNADSARGERSCGRNSGTTQHAEPDAFRQLELHVCFGGIDGRGGNRCPRPDRGIAADGPVIEQRTTDSRPPRRGRSGASRSAPARRPRRNQRRSPGDHAGRRPSCETGPMARKSWTVVHPVGVCQVVSHAIVPGTYRRCCGWCVLPGPTRASGVQVQQRPEDARGIGQQQARPLVSSVQHHPGSSAPSTNRVKRSRRSAGTGPQRHAHSR